MPGPVAATLWPWGEPMWEPSLQLRVIEQRGNQGTQDPVGVVNCIIPRDLSNLGDIQYTTISLLQSVPVRIVLLATQILPYWYIPYGWFLKAGLLFIPTQGIPTHLDSLGFLICLQPQPPPKSLLRGSCDFLLSSPGCPFSPSQPPFQTSLNISLQICFLTGPQPRGQLSIVGPSPGLVPPKSVSLMARPPGLLSIPWLAPSSPSLSLTQSHCLLLHSCPSLP